MSAMVKILNLFFFCCKTPNKACRNPERSSGQTVLKVKTVCIHEISEIGLGFITRDLHDNKYQTSKSPEYSGLFCRETTAKIIGWQGKIAVINMTYSIQYPRNVFIRSLFRSTARGIFPLVSKIKITGLQKFPKHGPLIVVGNHTGAMEVVLMGAYSPKAIEFMGAVEMPWNGFIGKIIDLYKLIPVHRGYTSNSSLKMGVDVLKQGGMLGIFPEGGFWEPGKQKAQTGVAWLSHLTQAPPRL